MMKNVLSLSRASRAAMSMKHRPAAYSAVSRWNSTSSVHENDPEVLEQEKQRNLSRTQHKTSTPHKDAPGWNETLASSSEASVKADRSVGGPTQDETIEYILTRHNPDDRVHTSATNARDEVEGPLGVARDEVAGPLGTAEGKGEDTETLVKKTVHEKTTEVVKKKAPGATASEESVKADRGEF
ncbi:hypothetical protein PQX77_001543 [Marasmius sp. AFHP31]|nr:hypothetical protein PQX77_001543 [Marasmius sp. AFHP31]